MLNQKEILSTIAMIDQQHLDIRTITMGISLLSCCDPDAKKACDKIYEKITRYAEKLVKTGEDIEREFGIPIVNKRISVTPMALVAGASETEDCVPFALALDRAAQTCGVNFIGGYSALVQKGMTEADEKLIRSIPEALDRTELVCSSINVGSTRAGINMDAVKLMGRIIKDTAARTADRDGLGCAKLVVFCNAVEDNPFMAGAFHGVGEAERVINVGVSGPGVVYHALQSVKGQPLDVVAETVKKTAFQVTRMGQLVAQEASRRLGFTATRTMRAAQTLYEGVDIAGHGTMGLITYMRTDSLRISDEAVNAAKEYIAGAYGEPYICPYKRTWKTKSATAAQDAHEAIRPSVPSLTPDEVDKSISGDTAKLYRMIWSRFMASQMADCIQDTVSASITAGDYLFRASGFRVSFDGFTALYEESTDDAKKKETALPPLEEGQTLKLRSLMADQKFTQPPPLYTEATLIHALEENGIGRPSTYAPIITTIVDRGYVEKDQKKLKTTPLGQAVNTVMMEQFPDIVNVKFSADMEKKLDVVEAGQADWVKTIDDFYQGFEKSLEQAEKNMEGKRIKVEDIPTDEICEKCGRPMVIKSGRYGKFVACSGFPECRNAHPLVKDPGGLCPLDGGHMLVRKSAKGRVYYGCSNYPKCNYMTWDEPVPEKCPQCGSTLFKKKGQLYCAKEGCGFVKAIEKK